MLIFPAILLTAFVYITLSDKIESLSDEIEFLKKRVKFLEDDIEFHGDHWAYLGQLLDDESQDLKRN